MAKAEVLFLAANPKNTTQLALTEECAAINRELQSSPGYSKIAFHVLWAATIDDVMRELNWRKPMLVHFSGHGDVQGIALIGRDGAAQLLSPQALAGLLAATESSSKAVLLNACYSDEQAQVISDTIGCAVGMRGAIADDAAREFSVAFYRALGHGRSLYNAFCQARAVLDAKGLDKIAMPRFLTRADVDASTLHLLHPAAKPDQRKRADAEVESPRASSVQQTAGRDIVQTTVNGGINVGDGSVIPLGRK